MAEYQNFILSERGKTQKHAPYKTPFIRISRMEKYRLRNHINSCLGEQTDS